MALGNRYTFPGSIVALGAFDGVHIGHQKVIDGAVSASRRLDVPRLALPGGEFRPQQEGPVVETLADDVRAQPVRGGLQGSDITARNALSFLRKPICARVSSCSMKLWPLR